MLLFTFPQNIENTKQKQKPQKMHNKDENNILSPLLIVYT